MWGSARDACWPAGRSRVAFLGHSSFGRPLVARSVCLREVHVDRVGGGDVLLAAPNSSSACPLVTPVFHRGLFESLLSSGGLTWSAALPRGLRKHNRTISMMEPWHPCTRLAPSACVAAWLSGVMPSRIRSS